METENILSNKLSLTEEKAAYDASCKRLLANKSILAWILKDCVEEFKDCQISDIEEKYIEGEPVISQVTVNPDEVASNIRGIGTEDVSITEGTVTYDIRFIATAPADGGKIELIINIEAQNKYNPGYPLLKRGIYYGSRMISSQYGTEFESSHYEKIKKVYSIWICMQPPEDKQNSITKYAFKEEYLVGTAKEKKEYYDLINVIMIYLGNDRSSKRVLKLLEVLLSNTAKADEKKQILKQDFEIKMTNKIEREVSDMCNLSDGVEARGIARGIEQGMAQGMAQGRAQGMAQNLVNLMDSLNISFEQAMTALKIPQEEFEKYKELVEKLKLKN